MLISAEFGAEDLPPNFYFTLSSGKSVSTAEEVTTVLSSCVRVIDGDTAIVVSSVGPSLEINIYLVGAQRECIGAVENVLDVKALTVAGLRSLIDHQLRAELDERGAGRFKFLKPPGFKVPVTLTQESNSLETIIGINPSDHETYVGIKKSDS